MGDAPSVARLGYASREAVVGNPVRTFTKDGFVVDFEREGRPDLVGCGVEFSFAEADAFGYAAQRYAAPLERDVQLVEGLFAVTARPPQLRILNLER